MSRDPGQADPPTASSDEDLLRQSDDEAASEHSASLSLASSSPPPASDQDLLQENEDDSLRNDSDAASSRSPSKHHDVHCFFAGNHYSVTHSRFKLRSGSVIRRRGESRRRSWWPCGVEPGSKHGTLDFSAGPAA